MRSRGLCPACEGCGELPDMHEWASYEARYDYRDGRVRVVRNERGNTNGLGEAR